MSTTEFSSVQPKVSAEDQTGNSAIDVEGLADLAAGVLVAEGVGFGHLDIFFVSADTIAELNSEHMESSGPTDVLAFPMDAPQLVGPTSNVQVPKLEGVDVHLGDIVICYEVAAKQAPHHAGTIQAELSLLVIHGVLHILGHDHAVEDERVLMQSRERLHLHGLGFDHPEDGRS